MTNVFSFLPFIVLIGAMFLMTRSAKRKQQQAAQMRNEMQPGTGVRTIGGMYATVKEVGDDTVLLEVAPGVHAIYAKNAIGAVLDDAEYNRIVHGEEPADETAAETPAVPDDASSLVEPVDPVRQLEAKEAADGAAEPKDGPAGPAKKADLTKQTETDSAGPVAGETTEGTTGKTEGPTGTTGKAEGGTEAK
ncbi:preprotein translocase subunit YajC [Streptomyces sp. LP05-1]|uniref:Preprotein translocase subunit YajC n=1 Tax=Streptomyces pyxinae TaxID=2970734 RepID=A0ABT2CGN2_9ACTN|nr:preprotein translocase subunit YajC [Streptomyces sp. LP05-1]MCS0636257.1 preprotein translocase subunit YajC [Streptomyces sp. LP05-1]